MSTPKSVTAQAVHELHSRCAPALDRYIEKHERRMSRDGLVTEAIGVLHAEGFDKVAHAIAAQLVVDRHVKQRSDIRLPSMKQLQLIGTEDEVRTSVQAYVFENGDGSITKLRDMLAADFHELDQRRMQHAKEALDAALEGNAMSRALLPYHLKGMNSEDAFVAAWQALHESEPANIT